jgi:hypothetical protein
VLALGQGGYRRRILSAFEEPKAVSPAIEVVLKTPEWMKLDPPEPVTIEHDANGDTDSAD